MADGPPSEIKNLIETHINAFNAQNNALFLSVFGDDAIIIDGIAPYRWLNPKTPLYWLAEREKWREAFQVTSEHLSYEMGFSNVEGSNAYAVVSATLKVTIKGQSRRSDRHPRIYVFKARRGVEDRCAGVGAHPRKERACKARSPRSLVWFSLADGAERERGGYRRERLDADRNADHVRSAPQPRRSGGLRRIVSWAHQTICPKLHAMNSEKQTIASRQL